MRIKISSSEISKVGCVSAQPFCNILYAWAVEYKTYIRCTGTYATTYATTGATTGGWYELHFELSDDYVTLFALTFPIAFVILDSYEYDT